MVMRTNRQRKDLHTVPDDRMTKTELVRTVSQKTGVDTPTVRAVYTAIVEEIISVVRRGGTVMLTGFGRFYRLRKAGHAVQFIKSGKSRIKGYDVLKFSASSTLNRSLSASHDDNEEDENDCDVAV